MRLVPILALAALAAVASAPAAARPDSGAVSSAVQTVVLTIRPAPYSSLAHVSWRQVKERVGPDERVSGANFAVRPGVPVRVVVWNYTRALHSFDAPELGVNVAILPGSPAHPRKAVFTFEAKSFGRFRWYCAVPCGGYMGGNVYAIVR